MTDQQLQSRNVRELIVERINRSGRPEKMRFGFEADQDNVMDRVDVNELKTAFLDGFPDSETTLENEPEADENHSFHLVGFDDNGASAAFRDDDSVDLNTYSRFEISPRTTGGRQA